MVFGLATLTRAVFVMFPLVIVWHLLLLGRRGRIHDWLGKASLFLVIYAVIVSSWTFHNLILWDRLVIVSDQIMPAIWRAAETRDGSPQQNDALLLEGFEDTVPEDCEIDCKFYHATETYILKIREIIGADPAGYLARRFNELLYSTIQPHGTTPFGKVSVMDAARNWIASERSLDGLTNLLQIEGFAIKLVTWMFHLFGIVFGLLGMFWSRRRWLVVMPLTGFLVYTGVAHFFLLALPRYLFPIEIIWLIFAGIATVELRERWLSRVSAESAGR